jgi:hypothetical protein
MLNQAGIAPASAPNWCTFATTFTFSYKVETVAKYSFYQELTGLDKGK